MLPPPTARLRFREMTSGDLDDMAVLLGDARVMTYYPAPKSREEAAAWIAWNRRTYESHGYGLWIIETAEGEFVGDCGLTWQELGGASVLEVGYHVLPRWQGRGLASEAAAACRDFARERVDTDDLVALIHPRNRASQRVAEKIGMQRRDDDGGDRPVRRVFGMRLRQVDR